jgi:glycosyltransferase involved in cell wall biosynthesis
MRKKIAFVVSSLPNTFFGGGSLTAYGLLLSLVREGYDVHLLTWHYFDDEEEMIYSLDKLGVNLYFLKNHDSFLSQIRSKFDPLSLYFRSGEEVISLLDKIKPCAILAYHWESLAAVYSVKRFPKIGLVGDPIHLPTLYRLDFKQKFGCHPMFLLFQNLMFKKIFLKKQKTQMKALLKSCSLSGAFAFHHAEMFRGWGINCRYFRTPIIDPEDTNILSPPSVDFPPKILLLGHLRGIATLWGLNFFTEEIFPRLLKELGKDGFQIHIVGDFFEYLPLKLKQRLLHPTIKIRGALRSVTEELLTSTLLLVPTPIELGIRVRILVAFSYGVPVIAHIANKRGIPELEEGRNILLGNTGGEIAYQIKRLLEDKRLQTYLKKNTRETYKRFFSLEKAGKDIIRSIEWLIR